MSRPTPVQWSLTAWLVALLISWSVSPLAQAPLSDQPEQPFKLATFEAASRVRLGMVLGTRVLDIAGANQYVEKQGQLPHVVIPAEMRALIERYAAVSPRLYQIANYFAANPIGSQAFAFDFDKVALKAPIKYPWNLMAASANYKAHAEGMGGPMAAQGEPKGSPPPAPAPAPAPPPVAAPPPAASGFDASAAARIVPDRDAPVMFAKSPRSCIIDPGEPFYIVDGRQRTDYEGEMAIVMGPRPAYLVPKERAHDYVFGYSILQDVSDRGSQRLREVTMFPGTTWFDGKSIEGGAPFGPVIVPKEFLPKAPNNLKITTRVNGEIRQDSNTGELIWDEAHLVAFLTSRMTLHPGDLISTGTPSGTGMERQKFLKPGDVVTVEIEGIGTLTTPFKALSQKPKS